jgi:heme/copper-type cytochrome/quinol oxidase subunit 2
MSGPVHSIASVFSRASTPAAAISGLSTLVLAVCLAIFAVVAGVLTYTVVRSADPGSIRIASRPRSTAAIKSKSPGR